MKHELVFSASEIEITSVKTSCESHINGTEYRFNVCNLVITTFLKDSSCTEIAD